MCQKHNITSNYTHTQLCIIAPKVSLACPICHVLSDMLSSLLVLLMCSSKLLWELRQDAAACLGLLCTVLSYEAERIFKWLFLKLTSSSRDEVKLLYLVATQRALETAGERKAFSHVMQVTTNRFQLISVQFCSELHFKIILSVYGKHSISVLLNS